MQTGTAHAAAISTISSGGSPEPRERDDHREGDHGADHHHLAVREVDQLDDAVDHGVAERDDGVHAAQRQAVDDLLEEDVHQRSTEGPLQRGQRCGAARAVDRVPLMICWRKMSTPAPGLPARMRDRFV